MRDKTYLFLLVVPVSAVRQHQEGVNAVRPTQGVGHHVVGSSTLLVRAMPCPGMRGQKKGALNIAVILSFLPTV
jgi:hypothetical protein